MFKFEEIPSVGNFLVIDTNILIDTTIKFINQNNIENLYINSVLGYNLSDIKAFSDVKGIKKVLIVAYSINLEGIEKFNNLEYLHCSCDITTTIDLSVFKKLKELSLTWSPKIQNIETLETLEHLSLRKFNGNIKIIQKLVGLKRLLLFEAYSFENLDFIKRLLKLNFFLIDRGRKLNDISGLISISSTLEELQISKCKKIDYKNTLHELISLKKLMISESANLPNLSFISRLKKLNFFSFVDTKVVDGNLSILKDIEYVGFLNKRHYTHKNVDGKLVEK